MDTLISLMNHPYLTMKLGLNAESKRNIDAIYPITLFFAFGIYLVYERYQQTHNSPVPFECKFPEPADPTWDSLQIQNPHLESHLEHPEIMPPMHVPERRWITSFDPSNGLHIGTFLADNAAEINAKIVRAENAQKKWKNTTFQQRRRVVRSLLKWLVDNQDTCARVACRDTGKTLIDAALGEILTTCSKMEWIIENGERALRPETRRTNLMLSYKKSQVIYEPLGVVAAIVSWNYPLHNAWSPILAAIFAGNGVVLKCSEHVVWSTTWFVAAITDCLKACGHDGDLIQVVCCYPEQADALTQSPTIKHITFIGSETVGRKVAVAATKHLTPVTLELGGKDPAVILPKTDLNKWASIWLRGVYQNMGQNCIGIERLIVHVDQYDELFEIFSQRVNKMRLGSVMSTVQAGYVNTVEGGAMINGDRFRGIEKLIKDANEGNAYVIGGSEYKHPLLEHGYYFEPTVVGPVDVTMDIANQELFAPIALLMPYETVEEAIEIANGTRYGLGASVFGPDQEDCLKVAKQLECGMVSINDFGGPEGLRSLTNPKAIITDRWPSLVQTSIPKVLDYPLRSLRSSWEFSAGLVRFLYGYGWRTRIAGLFTVIGAARQ
ncbi:Putative aldehyde dehydrogenase-like protein C21C3 [Psilocybe cubensis]|uniref:Aldehyde dehydrogenase-like protein C21C3 n=2 Tax=Psilocybe cubensis TaxID=181762 RepID=A0ACB8HA62_PSICU|nr:Putative aldehyde dehydrogenase-like protein C21C3 [Psilocybe cubensis]KAH9484084.1 Putative aldehyde dehydrogenase-like protein C21C3 [Psilocybe cubensis]